MGRWVRTRGRQGRRTGLAIEALESRTYLDAAAGADDRAKSLLLQAAPAVRVRQPAALAARGVRAAAAPAALPLVPARITGPGQIVARGDNAVFTVTLTKAPGVNRTVSVQFATVNGSATAGVHYTAQSGTLSFTGTETSKTIVVPTNPTATASRFPKPDMFSVKLSKPAGIKLTSSSATATIEGVRQGISVSPVAQAVMEGNSGSTPVVFNVSLVPARTSPVTVNYDTADGTATAGSDYQTASGTLTFAPGETLKQVTVNVLGDTTVEGQERFSLRLRNPVNARLGIAAANAYVVNDDTTSGPVGQVNIEMVTIDGDLGRGDIGNGNLGVVSRPYQIGKYEVTSEQYAAFLNTVAKTADSTKQPILTLWNSGQNIARSGVDGAYSYAPIGDGNKPIYAVSWFNAARFANWMHNGQGSGSTETGVYEFLTGRALTVAPSGATYTFLNEGPMRLKVGDVLFVRSERRENPHQGYARVAAVSADAFEITVVSGNLEDGFRIPGQPGWSYETWSDTRNPEAQFWLPTRDEWYRAAYYDPETRGLTRRYWDTAVRSSVVRGARMDDAGSRNQVHHANEYGGWDGTDRDVTGNRGLLFSQYGTPPFGDANGVYGDTNSTPEPNNSDSRGSVQLVTPVGSYKASASYYGTFDQTGNVSELLETLTNGDFAWQAVGHSAVNDQSAQWDVSSPAVPQLVPQLGLLARAYPNYYFFENQWHARDTVQSVDVYLLRNNIIQLVNFPIPAWRDGWDLVGFRLAAAVGTATGGTTSINVSVTGASQTEGAVSGPLAAAVAFTISLDKASSQPVFVIFATADGTATAGSDYVARSGVIVFEPGVIRQTVRVSLIGDRVKESQETFSLRLTSAINATLAIDTAVGTINDDD